MGYNNKSIQILRGSRNAIINNSSEKLLPGQLLYNIDDNYLTVGDNTASGKPMNGQPIAARKLHGFFRDNTSISASDDDTKYSVEPTDSGLLISSDKALELYAGSNSMRLNTSNEGVKISTFDINDALEDNQHLATIIYSWRRAKGYLDAGMVIHQGEVPPTSTVSDGTNIVRNTISYNSNTGVSKVSIGMPAAIGASIEVENGKVENGAVANAKIELHAPEITATGNITATGKTITAANFVATSDERLKTNIVDSKIDALELVNNLDVKEYNFKSDLDTTRIGLIAQEVLEKSPAHLNLVSKDNDGYYGINQNDLVAVLLKAVQELSKEVEDLKHGR